MFSPNVGKYGPEMTPYLDIFHAVGEIVYLPSFYELQNAYNNAYAYRTLTTSNLLE